MKKLFVILLVMVLSVLLVDNANAAKYHKARIHKVKSVKSANVIQGYRHIRLQVARKGVAVVYKP